MRLLHSAPNRNRVSCFVVALLSSVLLWGASAIGAPALAPESKRFLFIIDASASMKPLEDPLSEALFDLIYSGLRGKMTNGDSYGLWLVNDQNDTSFKMGIWKERYAVEMAAKAVKHVKDKGFRGKLRLGAAINDAAAVIRNVEDLTIILISNGETPIFGTPFDDIINVRFRELAPHMRRARVTLNTALVSQGGQFVAWAANTPEFLIEIPYVAPRPLTVPNAHSNATGIASGSTRTKDQPAQPRIASNPIIITRDTVAKEKRIFQALASTALAQSNDAPAETTSAAATNGATVIASNAPSTNVVATQVNESNSNAAATPVMAETSTAPTVEPMAPAVAVNSETVQLPPANGLAVQPPAASHSSSPLVWAGAGAGLALLCIIVGFFLARGRRSPPSLISQSLAQQRITHA